ncbi:MAG: hypothetical protein IPP48_14865 [Chitinophagaceae bacterium]|nr:hypothetical protein [Chitinophagaceae bacterium]
MKNFLLSIFFLFIFFSIRAQNNSGNYWKVWLPEVTNATPSDVRGGAFAITASNNDLAETVGDLTTDNCNSFAIGNDRRGYVYYDANGSGVAGTKLIRIVDPTTNTVVNSIDYSSVTPATGFLHSFNSFYIAATNKHYLVVSGAGGTASVTPTADVYIFDVTDVTAPTFVKSINLGSGGSLLAFNGTSSVTGRVTGLVLRQTTYTSAGVTMYAVMDNLKRAAAVAVTGTTFPGVFAKITDPLAASPAVVLTDVVYNSTDFFGAAASGSLALSPMCFG